MSITINFGLKAETKTCYRFESREDGNFVTLYLKKPQVLEAGIDPQKGIVVEIRQEEA